MPTNTHKNCADLAEVCRKAHLRNKQSTCQTLKSIGKYCADRAEVCPKANLRVVNTVQIHGGVQCDLCYSSLDLYLYKGWFETFLIQITQPKPYYEPAPV